LKTLKILWKNVFVHNKMLILLSLLSCTVFTLPLIPIWAQKQFLDRIPSFLTEGLPFLSLVAWLVVYYAARCLTGGFLIPAAYSKELYYDYKVIESIRKSQFRINNSIPLESFDSSRLYNIMDRADRALTTGAMRDSLNAATTLLTITFSLVSMLISLGFVHPMLCVMAVVSILPVFYEFYSFEKKMYRLEAEVVEIVRKQKQCLNHIQKQEFFLETRISGSVQYFQDKWNGYRDEVESRRRRIYKQKMLFGLVSRFVKSASMVGVIGLAGYLLSTSSISVGSFCAVLGILGMLYGYIDFFVGSLSKSIFGFKELGEIAGYFELEQEAEESCPDDRIGTIELRNVSFKYEAANENAVTDISVKFRKGEKVAILGVNGAGKTTLINLITSLFDPVSGSLTFDSKELKGRDKSGFRGKMATVFQDYQTFCLSFEDNVSIGDARAGVDSSAVIRAMDKAGFPYGKWEKGIATMIGKEYGGTEVSRGEAQKLSIARCYYREYAEVIVIDEPTAALDPRSEEELYRKFALAAEGKTLFMVSHRLGSVRIADRIIVMDSSRIVEDGTHDELLKSNGLYARMYHEQSSLYDRA
jgi:ATP-binding cassette, subfamily B, bacterial